MEVLVPEDGSLRGYEGWITVHGEDFDFHVTFPEASEDGEEPGSRSLDGVDIAFGKTLALLLRPHVSMIRNRMRQSQTLREFLDELRDLVELALCSNRGTFGKPQGMINPKRLQDLLAQIDEVGWSNVEEIGDAMKDLRVTVKDERSRSHKIRLILPPTWPSKPPVAHLDVPIVDGKAAEDAKGGRLRDIVERCRLRLNTFHDFWRVVEDFDKNTYVLEPANPSRSSTCRRVVLQRHCSIQVDIDPLRPLALCEIRFLGSDSVTGPLIAKLNSGLGDWKSDALPRENLENILEIKFPAAEEKETTDFDMECGICYSYRLDSSDSVDDGAGKGNAGGGPDRMCDNANCGRPFHRSCLVEWLRSIPTTTQSFHTLLGKCPYCQSSIVVDTSNI